MLPYSLSKHVYGIAAFLLITSVAQAATKVSSARYQFSFLKPDSFTDVPDTGDRRILYAYRKPMPDQSIMMLAVEDLEGLIGRNLLKQSQLPKSTPGGDQYELQHWKFRNIKISVVKTTSNVNNGTVVSYSAQIPLRFGGIQFVIASTKDNEDKAKNTLKAVLNSVKGPLVDKKTARRQLSTNERVIKIAGGGAMLIGVIALITYWGYRICLLFRKKPYYKIRIYWLTFAGLSLFGGKVFLLIFDKDERSTPGLWLGHVVVLLIGLLALSASQHLRNKAKSATDNSKNDQAPLNQT